MTFDSDKKTILNKIDKSKKGDIDKEILHLVDKINKSKNYYTTSSCSGRIVVLTPEKKQDARWLFITHEPAIFAEVDAVLRNLGSLVWFRFEPMILHVGARTIEDAQRLVNLARDLGFKRSGIQSTKQRIIIEIASTEIMAVPIAKNYDLKTLIEEANKLLEKTHEKIKKFTFSLA